MNPYGKLKDKEPRSRGRRAGVRYASGMEKSQWDKKPCGCVKTTLPQAGAVAIRCDRHHGKKSKKRLLCYWDENGQVQSEIPLPQVEPVPSPPPPSKSWGPRRVRPGQRIYFARLGNLIKIGTSQDVSARVERLNADLIGSIEGGAALEQELHAEFAVLRVRGEWFRAKPRLLRRIEELCA